jgi:uncharacterized protein (DUF885 family)
LPPAHVETAPAPTLPAQPGIQEDRVTQTELGDVVLTRPPRALDAGPLDDRLYDLVEARFRRLLRDNPPFATFVGIHAEDERLGDASRDAVLQEHADEHAHLAAVEALDPGGLSDDAAFERELEIHNLRRVLFDAEVHRVWERRSTAMDTVGGALFLLFARDFAPLSDRLESIAGRLEAVPEYLDASRTRAVVPQVRLWQQLEIDSGHDLPSLFEETLAAARGSAPDPTVRRLERATDAAHAAVDEYVRWVEGTLANGTDEWALGRDQYDELVALRAFDGLDADAILDIGWQQLAVNQEGREAAAREIDPTADIASVIDRIKSDHPRTFDEALGAYRSVMLRARQHLIDRDIVTVPADERVQVIATPEYLRRVLPFAAYFEPAKFDKNAMGIYVVTPSVADNPGAMREHNYSAISNTSIHEAYPGHHLQLSVAGRNPSLTRLTTDAPEFVEGWGMYSEQMMREQGFDTAPTFRVSLHTDAIWRACRIILDIRMHRGEIGVDDAVKWLVEQTSFEEPNARAEVHRYTYTPTYQLSYLLGKVLLLQLRADEQRRLGPAFSLRAFHDALLRNASIPISFHRRSLASAAARPVGTPGD